MFQDRKLYFFIFNCSKTDIFEQFYFSSSGGNHIMQKTGIGNTIRSRDIEPLLVKAGSILAAYEQAAESKVRVVDSEGFAASSAMDEAAGPFCNYCGKGFPYCKAENRTGDSSCGAVHQKAAEESRRLGGSYIYMCPMGLVFWTSPLYSGGRYAGSLISGKVPGIETEEICTKIQDNGIGVEKLKIDLEQVPRKNYEEIKALAQMMLLCAQQISAGKPGTSTAGGRNSPSENSGAEDPAASLPVSEPESPNFTGGAEPADEMEIPAQPSSNERLLIAAMRRGDSAAAKRILENILDDLNAICPGDLIFFRCRAIELVVLLSRSCVVGKEIGSLLEENNLYLKRIGDSTTVEELSVNLYRIIERMAGRIFSFQGLRHASALRRAERFIWKNYTRKVSLDEIAAASGLSAPYFSTIFREEMGEYLSTHLNRLRVEKACAMLIETNVSLNTISESCGFEDQSWFSKIFKNYTGYSPGKYREQGGINIYSQDSNCAG
jgi:AraC-like DNA-binding protein/ligand-binding sensor protein